MATVTCLLPTPIIKWYKYLIVTPEYLSSCYEKLYTLQDQVWGFCSSSNIEALHSKQKKGVRAVIPGYVNYHYNSKTGNIPGHTKLAFSKYGILAIQNLIALNALLFIHKTKTFPSLIPLSVRLTISEDSPTTESTYESCEDWLKKYNNHIYNKSVFFKGPMLAATSIINEVFSPESFF